MEPYKIKQVIVVRKELGMNMGKTAAQVSHASMAFLTKRLELDLPLLDFNTKYCDPIKPTADTTAYQLPLKPVEVEWLNKSFAKIVVYVNTAEELHAIHEKALEAGIEANFITDSGHTYFKGEPTLTCLGLGPDYAEKLDPITRELPLL